MVLRSVIRNFVRLESSSGIILLIAGVIALILSNSNSADWFNHILHLKLYFGTNLPLFYKSTQHWINDGLMVIFFFVVGLELKREFLEGELSMPSQAILPVIAAVGGMAVPAIFYLLFNFNFDIKKILNKTFVINIYIFYIIFLGLNLLRYLV